MRRLMREMATMRSTPPDGIRITTNEEDILDFCGIVQGPGMWSGTRRILALSDMSLFIEGTPYEGGYFRIGFKFTEEFPAAPPKCQSRYLLSYAPKSNSKMLCVPSGTMLTKIFHPNVSKLGEICVNTLKKDWKREYGIVHILVTVGLVFRFLMHN